MGFGDTVVKPYAGRPSIRNGTLEVADGWVEVNVCTLLGVADGGAVLGAFTIWNVTAGTDADGVALDPLPVVYLSNERNAELRDARSLTVAPDRDVKGLTFHPGEYVQSVWIKAVGADCSYEYVAEHEGTPK